jgi:chromosome partitioning protein
VRSASPPAGTTDRAGIAEASPAGERSGRDAGPGSAQDGETPTVDQSREWPFRDTAPRQDPAASRLDPIWGSDPPDAVRWHMDMTTDQEAHTSGSSDASPDSETDQLTGGERGSDRPVATSSPTDGDASATPASAEASASDSAPGPALHGSGQHGAPAPAGEQGDPEVSAVPYPHGAEGSSIEPAGALGSSVPEGDSGEGAGGAGPGGAAMGSSVGAADLGPSRAEGDSGEDAGALGPTRAEPRSGQSAGALDPSVAGMDWSLHAGPADPSSALKASREPAGGEPAQPDLSGQQAASDVGWFSTAPGGGQYTGPLSERLSAERPADTQHHPTIEGESSVSAAGSHPAVLEMYGPPGPQEPSSRERSGDAAGGPAATQPAAGAESAAGVVGGAGAALGASQAVDDEGSPPTDGPTGVGDPHGDDSPGAEEPSGLGRSGEPGGSPGSGTIHVGAGLAPVAHELRGPELIEPGMVDVDPDPEIGSTPGAAGWSSPPAARRGPVEGPGDRSDAETWADEIASQDARVGGAASSPEADLGPTSSVFGVPLRAEPDRREVEQGTTGDPGSDPVPAPWNEPALPMALPPGTAPSDLGEGGEPRSEEDLEGEFLPKPDPTWPRLFGSRAEARASETDDASTPPDQPAAPMHGTAGEQNVEGPGQHPWPEVFGGLPASDHDSPPVESRPEFVDVTTREPRIGGESAPEPGHRQRAVVDSSAVADVESEGDSNTSTVTRQTEAGEVDLRDAPTSPRSADVSRETSAGGGEGMEPGLEDEAMGDEAAVAVREAVSRAAAEAGVDVSRETSPLTPGTPIDELSEEPTIDREAAARSARVTFRIHRDTLNGDRRVLAVANQKGGVGKSTTAVNIGAYLALAGARVLVIDLDPQGNASTGLGLDHREIEPSIYDVLTGDAPPATAIRATGVADLHILPSTIDLAGAEVELVSAMSRETRLRRALESIDHQYDTILIDCPPSLGLLTVNALAAADELLIPIQCEYYALEGLGQLLRNVELVRANLNPELRVGGIVLTMYDGRTRLALQVVDEVRKHFTDVVYQTVVPRSVRLSEAPGYGLPIALYDPLSRGGIAYRDLTFELAERSGLLAPTGEGAS